MTNGDLLTMVKANLAITSVAWNTYLEQLIQVARKEIDREGITIDDEAIDDCNLIVMYASYLYRKRVEDNAAMPRMLRYALNNRVMAEKGATT